MAEPILGSEPIVGSEALASGALSQHQLRAQYRALFPNVYLPKQPKPLLDQRIVAAWLWSHREATVAGTAAAALHRADWIDDAICIELIYRNPRSPRGVRTRRDVLLDGESTTVAKIMLTTPERTAFDIGRRQPRRIAVAQLDSLARATGYKPDDVLCLVDRHRGARGLRRLETALTLVDPGAQSPRESYLRLLLVDAGLPRPRTQIPVLGVDGYPFAYLDMGWPGYMVAVEYDGDHHRLDRFQYVKDIRRLEELERMGWLIIRVVAEDRPTDIVRRVQCALTARRSSVRCRFRVCASGGDRSKAPPTMHTRRPTRSRAAKIEANAKKLSRAAKIKPQSPAQGRA